MSDETNTYGDDIHLTTTDATTIYNTLIAALEKGAGEPLYPGDERRIFGEGLVAVFVALYNSLDDTGRQTLLRYARARCWTPSESGWMSTGWKDPRQRRPCASL